MSIDPQAQGPRASDAERERVADVLREQHVVGRITYEELNDRLERAYGARTIGELELLTRDLPVPASPAEPRRLPAQQPRRLPAHLRVHLSIYLIFVVFFILIWLFGSRGYFWPIWPAMGWGVAVAIQAAVAAARRDEEERHASASTARTAAAPTPPQRVPVQTPPAQPPRAPAAERMWVAAMFTDIANSTTLTEALGDEEWTRFLVRHREMVRQVCREHGGREVSTQGDGFLVQFSDPTHAVRAAVDLQRRVDAHRDSGGLVPHVRIGIHAGEAVADDNDLLGRTVNVASRVNAQASPGEILVTEPVADRVEPWAKVQDRGVHTLRGVSRPRHLFAIDWSGA